MHLGRAAETPSATKVSVTFAVNVAEFEILKDGDAIYGKWPLVGGN